MLIAAGVNLAAEFFYCYSLAEVSRWPPAFYLITKDKFKDGSAFKKNYPELYFDLS